MMKNVVICCLVFLLSACSLEKTHPNEEELKNKILSSIEAGDVQELKKLKSETKHFKDTDDFYPMIAAAAVKNKEIMQLLHKWGFSYTEIDGSGNTPLHYAVYGGQNKASEDEDIIAFLLGEHVEINVKNNEGETPILLSLNNRQQPEITMKLIEAGADITQTFREGNSLLHEAVLFNRLDIAKYIVERNKETIHEQNKELETPLFTAIGTMKIDLAEWLLEMGADPNRVSEKGHTPLSLAVTGQIEEIITPLINANADVTKIVNGKTILELAEETENEAVIEMITEAMEE